MGGVAGTDAGERVTRQPAQQPSSSAPGPPHTLFGLSRVSAFAHGARLVAHALIGALRH